MFQPGYASSIFSINTLSVKNFTLKVPIEVHVSRLFLACYRRAAYGQPVTITGKSELQDQIARNVIFTWKFILTGDS